MDLFFYIWDKRGGWVLRKLKCELGRLLQKMVVIRVSMKKIIDKKVRWQRPSTIQKGIRNL